MQERSPCGNETRGMNATAASSQATAGPFSGKSGSSKALPASNTAGNGSVARSQEPAAINLPAAFLEHERWLRTVVLARVGERQAVDEVMQEISLAAVAGRSAPEDPAKVPAWFYKVAVTQTLLYRRKAGRRRKLTQRYADQQAAGRTVGPSQAETDPLHWLLNDERRQLVRVALEQLAPRDAEILLLKYTEDWSYRQLAEHLGLSESAVEARLHRARKRMRQKLAELKVIEKTS